MASLVADWVGIAASVISVVGIGVLTIWSGRQDIARKELNERLRTYDVRVGAVESKVTVLETNMDNLPTREERREVYEKLNELSKEIAHVSGMTEALLAVFKEDTERSKPAPRNRRRGD